MPGSTLKEAMNLFNPRRSLSDSELDSYYVTRPNAPLEGMKTYLQINDEPVKVLFSGHRGSGKSTELRRLARDLENDFFIVHVSAVNSLNIADLNYVDVVLACAAAIFREATDKTRGVKIPPALAKDVFTWLASEITSETTITTPKSGAISAKINAFILSIEGKYGRESQTRTVIRDRLFTRVSDLIDRMDEICTAITTATGHRTLIIFEDIDKTDLAHARDLFFEHSSTLNKMGCHIIYTFPIPLCYSTEFTERIGDYSKHFLLPNVSVHKEDDTPDPAGHSKLEEAITRRVSANLFTGETLNDIISASGGLMRDLVRLVRDAALTALTNGEQTAITADVVHQAASEMGDDFRRLLRPEHYAALRSARGTKQIVPDETGRQLLENLSLLEYRTGRAWCDVHPVVRPLL